MVIEPVLICWGCDLPGHSFSAQGIAHLWAALLVSSWSKWLCLSTAAESWWLWECPLLICWSWSRLKVWRQHSISAAFPRPWHDFETWRNQSRRTPRNPIGQTRARPFSQVHIRHFLLIYLEQNGTLSCVSLPFHSCHTNPFFVLFPSR